MNLTARHGGNGGVDGKLLPFAEMLPDQIVEVGIAEQNLVGIAAGLASAGKTVFAVSPACFLTTRPGKRRLPSGRVEPPATADSRASWLTKSRRWRRV